MTSATAVIAINAEQTEEAWIALIEITHASLVTPIRVANNPVAIVSNGNTFLAGAFVLTLPDDSEAIPVVTMEIDNVDRAIVDAARSIATPPQCAISVVLGSTPNVIEAGPFNMTMNDVNYNFEKVTATLIYEDLLNEPFPAPSFNPALFPGLF